MNRTMKISNIVIIIIILLFLPGFTAAEADLSQDIIFETVGEDGNGPNGYVRSVLQDHYGFMWFVTYNGIYKYDGYKYTHFKYKPNDPNGIGSRIVLAAHEDKDGVLWFGMVNSLDRFDRGTRAFSHFRTPIRRSANVEYSGVGGILDSSVLPGTLWIISANGLERFDKKTGTFSIDQVYNAYSSKYPSRALTCFCEDDGGILWFGTIHGLHKYDVRNKKIEVFRAGTFDSGNISGNRVNAILPDPWEPNILWIGTMNGFNRLDKKTSRFNVYRHDPANPRSISNNIIASIARSYVEKNTFWIGTAGGGLNKFNSKTGMFYSFKKDPDKEGSLGINVVNFAYENTSGVLWTGMHIGKLYTANAMGRRFTPYSLPPTQNMLNDQLVTAIIELSTDPGTLWLGTMNGLQRFQRQSCVFTPYRAKQNNTEPGTARGERQRKQTNGEDAEAREFFATISNNAVIEVKECLAEPGKIWVATLGGGLNKFDPETGSWQHYKHNPKNTGTLSDDVVLGLYQSPDRPGELWAGTQRGILNRMTIKSGHFVKYVINPKNSQIPPAILVMRQIPDQPEFLWVGSMFRGLIRFNIKNRRITRFREIKDTGNYADSIFALHYSPNTPGYLWLGGEKGLMKIDTRTGKFRDFRGKNDLSGFQVGNIIEDRHGRFWIPTNTGLVKFDVDSGNVKLYDIRDGLRGNECSRAVWKSKSGEIFIGSQNGFNSFFPNQIKENTFKPPIVITDFQLFNRSVKVGETGGSGKPLLERHITDTKTIRLTHKDKMFAFRFAALNYILPEKNQYAYKMEGFDNEWNNVGNTRTAVYTGLPHGEYRFRVKGSNNDGIWNENDTSIRIIISPPWWQTAWAYALYVFLFICLLAAFYRLQHARVVAKEREQAKLTEVELRAKAAEAQAMALESENKRKVHELEEARKLQLSMLPKDLPKQGELDIGVYMKTATEVGGDYYDFYTAEDGSLTVAVGDATGHGLKAGTMVSIIKGVFLAEVDSLQPDIELFFTKSTRTIKQMRLGNLFMALILLRVKDNRGVIASAGMPPVYLYRGKTGKVEEIIQKAPPIGAFDHFIYHHQDIRLCKGDTLLMLSDGLPELFNGDSEMFGYDRIKELIKEIGNESPHRIINHLVKAGEEWLQGKPQDDDITFVVLKVK